MKYYHVAMNILDVMVVCHLHFWSAYAMAVFLDRYIPTPRQKQDFNVGSVTFSVLAQIRVYIKVNVPWLRSHTWHACTVSWCPCCDNWPIHCGYRLSKQKKPAIEIATTQRQPPT